MDTPGIEDILEGRDSVQAVLEIKVRVGSAARTYLQTPCTVLNDMIEGSPMVPPPFATPATLEQLETMLAGYVPLTPPGGALRVTPDGLLQLRNATTGLWHAVFVAGAAGAESLAIGPANP
jgi:hypothetical protein